MNESELSQRLIVKARELFNSTLLRNNSGAFKNPHGRWVRFGLGNVKPNMTIKSSDYIGITPVVITPDMVGKTVGVFTAIEFKEPLWKFNPNDEHEVYQSNFIQWVKSLGCFGGFVKDLDSLKDVFKQ